MHARQFTDVYAVAEQNHLAFRLQGSVEPRQILRYGSSQFDLDHMVHRVLSGQSNSRTFHGISEAGLVNFDQSPSLPLLNTDKRTIHRWTQHQSQNHTDRDEFTRSHRGGATSLRSGERPLRLYLSPGFRGTMSQPNTVLPKVLLEIVDSRPLSHDGAAIARPRLQSKPSLPSRIAVIGNYLPRHCGIATFTTDLCAAISTECGSARLMALPVNDTEEGYDYPDRVRWSLAQDDVKSYQDAAEFLNFNNIDMVCLQHEYGIFGGPAGRHILHMLRALKMPVVTTLHTVLREPNPEQTLVMQEIAELSDRLIVMSDLSSQFLQEIFKVPGSKIDIVPHGVPDLPFLDPNFYKDRFGVEGKAVLLTFGLLSPNKGIEN